MLGVCHYSKSTWICIYYYFIEIPHIDFFSLFQIIIFFVLWLLVRLTLKEVYEHRRRQKAFGEEEKQIYFCACHSCMKRAREFQDRKSHGGKEKKCWFLFTNGAKISLSFAAVGCWGITFNQCYGSNVCEMMKKLRFLCELIKRWWKVKCENWIVSFELNFWALMLRVCS